MLRYFPGCNQIPDKKQFVRWRTDFGPVAEGRESSVTGAASSCGGRRLLAHIWEDQGTRKGGC